MHIEKSAENSKKSVNNAKNHLFSSSYRVRNQKMCPNGALRVQKRYDNPIFIQQNMKICSCRNLKRKLSPEIPMIIDS